MNPALHIALRAARAAADVLLRAGARPDRIHLIEDRPHSPITSVHQEADAALIRQLRKVHPKARITSTVSGDHDFNNHPPLEGGQAKQGHRPKLSGGGKADRTSLSNAKGSEIHWLVDPLVGGRNFLAGLPAYGVSLLCQQEGNAAHAVLLLPESDEEFLASRGGGARLNKHRLRAEPRTNLSDALIGLDWGGTSDAEADAPPGLLPPPSLLQRLHDSDAHCRLSGSPTLDLLATAANRLQGGFCHPQNGPAFKAARLILQESGGLIADQQGNPDLSTATLYIYGNPTTFKQLLQLTAAAKD